MSRDERRERAIDPIKVAFWYDRPIAYSGGLNYVRNLLYAIAAVNDGRLSPYLFIGKEVPDDILRGFAGLATIIRTPLLDRGRPWWYLNRLLVKSAGLQWLVKRQLREHGIEVLSHAEHVATLGPGWRIVSWFPDFQFLHLPDLFPGLDVDGEIKRLRGNMRAANAIVLSSQAALEDFKRIAPPELFRRAHVLRFVSQPDARLNMEDSPDKGDEIRRRYRIESRYFYLPNQFWVHKNHKVVFEAVASLKKQGLVVTVICTGNLRDYRVSSSAYVDSLEKFIVEQGLEENIRILGMVPYEDVLFLMRNCVAVINPSRFEGWSSTVEEARSIGKRLALSNIAVHREQNPPRAMYFDPDDVERLSAILRQLWLCASDDDAEAKMAAAIALRERTAAYGAAYIELVQRVRENRPPNE